MPAKWQAKKITGEDWMTDFLSRCLDLFTRSAEATYLARDTDFNKKNIAAFYCIIESVIQEDNFQGINILNLNESGVTTEQKVPKVISERG